jgi:ABC-type bacteriocin/lantibiotic exporter with double-glycine peptidase domain
MKKKLQGIRDSAKTIHSKLIQHLKEAIAGFVESNIYLRKKFFLDRFVKFLVQQSRGLAEQQIIQSFPPRLIEVFAVFGLFFLIVINFFTKGRTLDLVTIGAFMAAAYKIIPGIVKIYNSLGQIRTYDFTVQDLLSNQSVDSQHKIPQNTSITSIAYSNVSFGYENTPVLNNFHLEINRGDFIGLTGKSGKGKTTAMNLLLGFLEPDSGSVLINGSVKEMSGIHDYWKNIAYVQQQPFLINDTILHNITLQENDHDLQRLNEVIRITGLQQLTGGSAEGLDKPVMEEGKNISGGQRQRIALARALYKNADLIILDEPFNELDKESENYILNYLNLLAQSGKIIILITHDKESLSFCSKTISLDEK